MYIWNTWFMLAFIMYYVLMSSLSPISMAISILYLGISFMLWLKSGSTIMLYSAMLILLLTGLVWLLELLLEAHLGYINTSITDFMKSAFILFIGSEVMFFLSFFWAYLHNMLTYSSIMSMVDMYAYSNMIITFLGIPLVNTFILLLSGLTLTWAHHNLHMNSSISISMTITLILALLFTMLQLYEYSMSSLTMSDSMMGAIFFLSTGFHGVHVMLGSMMLFLSLMEIMFMSIAYTNHIMFEVSLMYFHFVDVVWMFLYLLFYYWL